MFSSFLSIFILLTHSQGGDAQRRKSSPEQSVATIASNDGTQPDFNNHDDLQAILDQFTLENSNTF